MKFFGTIACQQPYNNPYHFQVNAMGMDITGQETGKMGGGLRLGRGGIFCSKISDAGPNRLINVVKAYKCSLFQICAFVRGFLNMAPVQ